MQYGVIPKLYGEFRFVPPLAGNAYTSFKNATIVAPTGTTPSTTEPTQYLHMLLCLGYGPMRIGGPEGPIIGQPTGEGLQGDFTLLAAGGIQSFGGIPNVLTTDALAILVGDTPFGLVKGAKYLVGTATAVTQAVNTPDFAQYARDVEQDNLSYSMPMVNTLASSDSPTQTSVDNITYVHTSGSDPKSIEVDILFNSMIVTCMKEDKSGTTDGLIMVNFQVWKKRSLSGTWVPHTNFNTGQRKSRRPQAWTVQIPIVQRKDDTGSYDQWGLVPEGTTYDIKIVRVDSIGYGKNIVSASADATWTALRSIKEGKIWKLNPEDGVPEAILMALEFQATGQISGSIDPISVRAESVLRRPVVDTRAGWATNKALKWQATSSPAWAYADVFLGRQLQKPMSKDQIDWPALLEWANWCDGTTNLDPDGKPKITTYNWYHADEETMLDRLRAISSCGRATWAITNGLFSVIQDTKFYPVQLISPRNSRGFELAKAYPKIPHALRVRYVNPKTQQQDEVIVLDDYYLLDGVDNWGEPHTAGQGGYKNATTFEVLETQGVTNKKQAKREGRYYIATLRLRPEVFTCEMDFENLVAQRGDCVLLSHDVLVRGRAFGRITKITPPGEGIGDYLIDVDTDFEVTDEPGFRLQVRSINSDPNSSVPLEFVDIPINNPPGKYTQAWVGASQAAEVAKVLVDDLFVLGPSDEDGDPTGSMLAKITQIDYQPDMSAKLTMVYAAPGVATADDGIIDDDDGGAEPPPERLPPDPPSGFRLALSSEIPDLTEDGPRFTVNATWSLVNPDPWTDTVEIWFRFSDNNYESVDAKAGVGLYEIKKVPTDTQVTAKARAKRSLGAVNNLSVFTEEVTLVTPSLDELLPQMPIGLDLVQDNYKQSNGKVIYDIKVAWQITGYSGGCELQWRVRDTLEPDKWQGLSINVGEVTHTIRDVKLDAYLVRVRNKSIIYNDLFSAWNEGEIELQAYDYPPGPPTNLQAKSTPSGIMLTWDNPLDSDFAGIEIYHNIGNTRSADLTVMPPVPAASLLTRVTNPTNNFFHVPDDRIWHYYWIRSYDSEDGINPTNVSTWERPGDDDGVRGRQGTFGDGVPPPPPVNLVLTPGTWQITLQWEQSQEIPDLFGTQIYFSTTNDRGPDEALLATYLGVTDEKFATHLDLETDVTYYYWIRNIDVENLTSTWLPADRYGGAAGTTLMDPRKYLELLNGAITETQLAQSLLTLLSDQDLTTNSTILQIKQVIESLKALFTLKIQQTFEGLTEVSGFGMGSEIQDGQIVSQFLVQADRFAVGAPAVYNADEVLLVPIQYDWDGNLPTVYDKDGNVITPYGFNGLPLPAHNPEALGFIRTVYDAEGNRIPIYTADGEYFPTPRWDGFIVTTEEYVNAEGKMIPPGVYIRNANIAEGSIDGAKIRAESITADRINTRGLTIKDNEGNVIFSANQPVDLTAMFGAEMAEALLALKDKNIHLYIKNGVIGDLYIADELSSVDYSASYFDDNHQYVPGTGWRIHKGGIDQKSTIETDNLEARGTLSSDIYVPGAYGWKIFRDGSCEFNSGVFRGTLGAETLLIGTDFSLAQLSEQVLLASLNISSNGQFFKFTEGGNPYGDVNLTFFVNNLDTITWSARSYPGGAVVTLDEQQLQPRYRLLNINKMTAGVDYIEVKAQYQDRYDVVKVFPLHQNSGTVTAFASNSRINLAADSRGHVANYSNAVGKLRLFNGWDEAGGAIIPRSAVTYSIVSTEGCTATIVNDNTKVDHGHYKITSTSTDTGSVTLRAVYGGNNYDVVVDFAIYQAILSGTPGQDGQNGERGTKYFLFFSYDPGGYTAADWAVTQPASGNTPILAPSTDLAELQIDAWVKASEGSNGQVVLRDVVTLINYTSGYQSTRMRTQTGWIELAAYIAGNMLVDGTLYAKHIVASGITLSAGSSSQDSAPVTVGSETGDNFLAPVLLDMKDDFEAVHLFFSGAIQVASGGLNTTVTIFFKKSLDGGNTWETLGSQTYGVPGDPIPILLPYSYNIVVQNQPYAASIRYRASVKVPGGNPNGVRVYDRTFTVLGTYR
jgi:hypothetical protein